MCQQIGKLTPASVADHVVPHRGDPGLFMEGELQSLCAACHSRHKQSEERTGKVQGCDVSGVPLDPKHPWRAI